MKFFSFRKSFFFLYVSIVPVHRAFHSLKELKKLVYRTCIFLGINLNENFPLVWFKARIDQIKHVRIPSLIIVVSLERLTSLFSERNLRN